MWLLLRNDSMSSIDHQTHIREAPYILPLWNQVPKNHSMDGLLVPQPIMVV